MLNRLSCWSFVLVYLFFFSEQERNSTSNSDLLSNNDKQQIELDVDKSYGSTEILHHAIDRTEKGMKAEVPDCDCFGPGI